ncbi:MAG: hypothetical protein HXY20_14705 [Acidobacteria bacterium]|nr:hypothetical protein [Acidobacteriota bacterium]
MTNAAVVSMVKGGMPESLIVSTIQSSETQFDVSPQGLAELKTAGVGKKVMDAMVAAEARKQAAAASSAGAGAATAAASHAPLQQPYVRLLQEKAKHSLAAERAQIAQVKTKNQDLSSLAAETLAFQVAQGLAAEAATQAAARSGSAAAGAWGGAASGVMGGLFKKKPPTLTYVWGVPGPTPSNALPTDNPKFEIVCDAVPGVNADEYTPVLVKLVPAKNNWRLVGAGRGKEDATQSTDWDVYSSFVEQKVPAKINKTASGRFELEPSGPLAPGEYALVLRPLARNKKYIGADLTSSQGEGLVFNSAWTFSVASSGTP